MTLADKHTVQQNRRDSPQISLHVLNHDLQKATRPFNGKDPKKILNYLKALRMKVITIMKGSLQIKKKRAELERWLSSGPRFRSQHSHDGSQPPVTLTSSFSLCRHKACTWFTYIHADTHAYK